MNGFSKRRVNRRTLNILRKVGRVIGCYQQISGFANEATDRVPADPYADNAAPVEADYKLYYIFAEFVQDEPEETTQAGRVASVTGTLTIPWIYKSILAQTAYFDPYLNGSKFIKVGAAVDSQNVLITQRVKAQYLPQSPEVT